jgi:hypothetical protein
VPGLSAPILFEEGDRLYLVGPLAPQTPSEQQIEEYAYGRDLLAQQKQQAPNEHLAWFAGHYVSADGPNLNGAAWTSGELAVKKLTPMFMPVTIMHDPRTAVGLIADTRLLTPDKDSVPRAKIETALALWKHRFPEAVEEASHNYSQGTLMQSMECLAPDYSCSSCGMVFHKLPGGAERANWCEHLNEMESAQGVRTLQASAFRFLRNVTFTGTGLIFGSRGAQGADPEAHLEDFQAEVAEFHQRVHRDRGVRRSPKRAMDDITIPKSEYDELRSRPARDELAGVQAKLDQAESDLEKAEAAKAKVEGELASEKKRAADAEEKANRSELRDERMSKLGPGFTAKLGEKTKARLTEQASVMQDEEWASRLEELEEAYGVKPDADADGSSTEEFSQEEVARSVAGRSGGSRTDRDPQPAERRSVIGGLVGTRK